MFPTTPYRCCYTTLQNLKCHLPFSHYRCYKNVSKFIFFSSCNSYYPTYIIITCYLLTQLGWPVVPYLLQVLCPPAEQYVCSLNSIGVFHLNNLNLLKCETAMLISSGLCPQHPNLNSVNYTICTEMQQRVYIKNLITCTD